MISLILFLLYGPMPPKPEAPTVPWKVYCDNLHDDSPGLQFIVNYPELVPSHVAKGWSFIGGDRPYSLDGGELEAAIRKQWPQYLLEPKPCHLAIMWPFDDQREESAMKVRICMTEER